MHRKKYIEEELARRQGQATSGDAGEEDEYVETEDARRQREIQEREENMRGAMLSGIPEVDLGIDAKIKNIEETERARQEMLKKQHTQSNSPHPGASTADDITASHQFRCMCIWDALQSGIRLSHSPQALHYQYG
jgi:hypothetical protein